MFNRAVLLALLTAALHFWVNIAGFLSRTTGFGSRLQLACNEPESCMAVGIKIPFRRVDHYALQLIPGVGEDLASEIINQRSRVCGYLRTKPTEVMEALTRIKGVGPAIARKLDTAIDFGASEGC